MSSAATIIQQAAGLIGRQDWKAAEALAREGVATYPKNADLWQILGVALENQGILEDAGEAFRTCLKLQPKQPAVWISLGQVYMGLGDLKKAKSAFEKALRLQPGSLPALQNLGAAERMLGNRDRAERAYRKVLSIDAQFAPPHTGLGLLAQDEGRTEEAAIHFQDAWSLDTGMADPMVALSSLYCADGNLEEAVTAANAGLAVFPDNGQLRCNRALAELSAENWARAWTDYEYRFQDPVLSQTPWLAFRPRWSGVPSPHEELLVWADQGLGDLIVACHALPWLLEQAGRVVVAADPRLRPALERSFPGLETVDLQDSENPTLESITHQAPAFDLIRYAYANPNEIPAHEPWLKADPERVEAVQAEVRAVTGGKPAIGLGWTTTSRTGRDSKSLPLEAMAPVLQSDKVTCFSLQHGDVRKDLQAANKTFGPDAVHDLGIDPLEDLEGHLAQIAAMDAVLCTSSSITHFAGALGVPTTVLLPKTGSGLLWYWFWKRTDSPWYANLTIERYEDHPDLQSSLQVWTP